MSTARVGTRTAVVFLVAAVMGCQRGDVKLAQAQKAPAQSGQVSAPFDVQKVINQVHFAYRPAGSGWEGGHSTYSVRVDGEGVEVTPFHFPDGRAEDSKP